MERLLELYGARTAASRMADGTKRSQTSNVKDMPTETSLYQPPLHPPFFNHASLTF